jgi:NitT/TauT family transport system substrate-binding protein
MANNLVAVLAQGERRVRKVQFLVVNGIVALCTIALVGVLMNQARSAELTPASLRLKWTPQAWYAGYYVAKAKGWYAEQGIDLTINPGGPNIIAENLVAAGADTFGNGGGAASLLVAREKGLPLVGIGMLHQQTPYRFAALDGSNIKKFSDLKGKTVSTWFTGPQFMLQAMLKSNGVDPKDVQIEAQGPSMDPLIQHKVDMAIVTVYNEALVLKRRGIVPAAVFNPADMGVNLPNESIITSEKVVKESPNLVQGFMNATLRGWKFALENPDESASILVNEIPGLKLDELKEQFAEIRPLMVYGKATQTGVALIDRDAMEAADKFLVENGVLKKPVDVDAAIDASFWNKVPADRKIVAP